MATATFDFGMPSGAPGRTRRKADVSVAKAWLGRVAAYFTASNAAKQESEIAEFIDHRGGVLTDDIEREISRRFGSVVGR